MTAYRPHITLISFLIFGVFLIAGSASAYSVSGDRIFNSNGEEVPLYGVSWFGFETTDHVPHGLWTRNWQSMIEQIKGLGFNAVRLPVCPGTLRGVPPLSIDYYANPDLAGKDSLELLDMFMAEFSRQGIYILLDNHRPDCLALSELWYTDTYTEENWIDDMLFLATRYADNPHLVGIDIKNEPHGAATWGTGNPATDWNKAAERCAAAILAVNPEILIFVEGIQENPVCSGTINHWWGGNLEPQNCYPLNIPANRLVFSPHVYGPDVWPQSYFDDPNFPENMPAIWDAHFGYLADEGKSVVPGEFGGRYGHDGDPKDIVWHDALIDYFLEKNITNFFYWCWNPNSSDTRGILKDDWTTVWDDKVTLLHRLMGDINPTPTPGPTGAPTAIQQPSAPTIPTPTPDQPGELPLRILYYCQETGETVQSIKPWFQLENIGTVSIDLTDVTIRYWYTVDGDITQQFWCDWAGIGSDNIKGEFKSLENPTAAADYCLELSFGSAGGSLDPGESTGPIQIRFNRSDWTTYDQSDDYSFAPEFTSYGENSSLSGYLNSILVYGTEPNGTQPMATATPETTPAVTPPTQSTATPASMASPPPTPISIATVPPTPGLPAGFPERVFAPYVDVCIYPRFFITEQNQAMGVKYYTLAFVVSDSAGNGIPTWGGYMEYVTSGDWYRDEINGIRARGGDVIVSFGGEAGIELAMAHNNVESLRAAYQSVIDTYNLTWVDFDIEGAAVADQASIDRRNKAIKLLQDDNPDLKVVFCLPVIPSGLTLDGMNLLRNAIANGVRVDGVNIMAMYFGASAPNPNGRMGEYAIEAANSLFDQLKTLYPAKTDSQLWQMVGVTPVMGRSTATEVFYLADAQKLVTFGLEKNICLLSMWSANRDNGSCGTVSYYSPLCSSLEQEDFAFSTIFDQFTGQSAAPSPTPVETTTPATVTSPTAAPINTSTPFPSVPPTPRPTLFSTPTSTPLPFPEPVPVIADGDYNGDGASEIAIFRPSSGLWAIRGITRSYFGTSGDIPASGDYNGDGTAQIAVFRPASGRWAIKGQEAIYFGRGDDTPVPGDYNGDGKDDIAIYRPEVGLWAASGLPRIYFGAADDIPLPGDYNGDGTDDITIFRPDRGLWSIKDQATVYFGGENDLPIPADYDGDGEKDIAIFRPDTGLWAIEDLTRSYFGREGDTPLPADYDGDSNSDIAVFRATSSLWAVRGVTQAYFGGLNDIPVTR